MNNEWDALERELQAMHPCELSRDVRQRIDQSLARDSRSSHRTAAWWWGGLVAAAACLAIAAFAWHSRPAPGRSPTNGLPEVHNIAIAPIREATLGSYKLAFARSPDRFDALLDKEAARPLATADGDSRTLRPFDFNLIP